MSDNNDLRTRILRMLENNKRVAFTIRAITNYIGEGHHKFGDVAREVQKLVRDKNNPIRSLGYGHERFSYMYSWTVRNRTRSRRKNNARS